MHVKSRSAHAESHAYARQITFDAELENRLAGLVELRGGDRAATLAQLVSSMSSILESADLQRASAGASQAGRTARNIARWFRGRRSRLEEIVKLIPGKLPKRALDPRRLPLRSTDMTADGLARVRLKSGHTFLGYPTTLAHRRLYYMLRDLLPPQITVDTYDLAIQVQQRYCDVACEGMIKPGDTVFEVGAFFGLKAIRFADECAPDGRVFAVEMMPDNEQLMRRNIEANDLQARVTSFHCGVWNATGSTPALSSGRQRNSLVDIDDREFEGRVEVPVDTLDNLIDRSGAAVVDFLNMQVNGAEIEALHGLERRARDVRLIRIGSHYSRGGVQAADVCTQLLVSKGFDILWRSGSGSILAQNSLHPAP